MAEEQGIEPHLSVLETDVQPLTLFPHLERSVGIEPTASAWKAEVLPLYEPRIIYIIYSCLGKVNNSLAHLFT